MNYVSDSVATWYIKSLMKGRVFVEYSVKQAIREHKLITIIRNVEREKLLPQAQAMYDGGIRLYERGSKNNRFQIYIRLLQSYSYTYKQPGWFAATKIS